MSDHWLILIPTRPDWVPDADQAAEAVRVVEQLTAAREGPIESVTPGKVEFVHCGTNFETIGCPSCGTALEMPWWDERMNAAYGGDAGFGGLDVATPCCGAATTLNELDYNFPQGFASWWVQVLYANRPWLDTIELALVETALGHAVREIRRHL